MRRLAVIARVTPVVVSVAGALTLAVWLGGDAGKPLAARLPGADRVEQEVATTGVPAPRLGRLTKSADVPAPRPEMRLTPAAETLPGAWPRFRNAGYDGLGPADAALARQWDATGPPVLWSLAVGEGHAGAAVLNGRVYLLDYDREQKADALRCLSLADGREIWRYSYPVKVKRNHGMSRTVPAVTEKHVVTLGPKCHVMCLDAASGELRWCLDLVNDYGARVPPWYAAQCPLIDDGRAILAPAGDALMLAVDCETGNVVWQAPNPFAWSMTHSSIIPLEFGGRRMYVYCGSGGVVGVAADTGQILWYTSAWKIDVACVPTPVDIGSGRIFLTGGYEAGSMMLQLKQAGAVITAEPQFRLSPKVFGCEQHTPIFYGGYIYGVRPDGQLICLDTSGKVMWESGHQYRFPKGYGPWLIAGGLIYVMNGDDGTLSIVEATAAEFRLLSRAKVLDGHDSWGPMALAGGRLLVRDLTTLRCLDVGQRKSGEE